jgi:hypothetical protein
VAPPFQKSTQKLPALHGRLMVDTINGRVRLRKWPEKRGPKKTAVQQQNVDRFTEVQRLSKNIKGSVFNYFIEATKGSGLYPRDLFTKMVLKPPIEVELLDGTVIRHRRPTLETEVFQGAIFRGNAQTTFTSSIVRQCTFGAPLIDTSMMTDFTKPGKIIIPPGVAICQFWAGWHTPVASNNAKQAYIGVDDQHENMICACTVDGSRGVTTSSGPVVVAEGEEYAFWYATSATKDVWPAGTFFACQILAASV